MYKNQSQELVQKAGLTLPVYQNVNEGLAPALKFRAPVCVGKTKYTSELTFKDIKAAEQDVAKLAYESMKSIKFKPQLGPLLIHQEPIFCKSILHEYAVKMNVTIPKYQTIPQEGPRLAFISSFDFCGKTYTGEVAQSKKLAERLAAKAAIQSLLGPLHQVIKLKENLYASLYAKISGYEGNSRIAAQQPGSIPQQQASIEVPRQQANIQVPQQQANIQVPWQKASIETDIINYNAGHEAFPTTERRIKRKLEFKPRVQNTNRSHGKRSSQTTMTVLVPQIW